MAPSTGVPAALAAKLESAQKVVVSESKLVYQIVAVQLRVWLADQKDVACRPWYIFCLELYPRGKVVNQVIHSPASEKPQPHALLRFLLNHIVNPPAGEKRARPTNVSFIDQYETDALRPFLSKLKIEVGTLSLADGIDEYVRLFSNKLIDMDKASRGEASERPGLLSVKGVAPDMVADLMHSAVEWFRVRQWKRIPEHIALEIRLPSSDGTTYRDRYYVTILGSDGKAFGFVLMPSLTNLRDKYRRTILRKTADHDSSDDERVDLDLTGQSNGGGHAYTRRQHAVSKTTDDILLCGACGKRVGETFSPDGAKYVYRCGGCRRLLYCDERCQKLDWRERHRYECQQATTDPDFIFKREEWAWLQREVALIFLDPTSIPFDDLDAYEKHNWDYIKDSSPPTYPMPMVTVQGSTSVLNKMDRPSPKELNFITLIAKALTECHSPPPPDGIMHLVSGVSVSFAENLAQSIHVQM